MIKTVAALMKAGLEDWSAERPAKRGEKRKPKLLFSSYVRFFLFFTGLLCLYMTFILHDSVYLKDGNFEGI